MGNQHNYLRVEVSTIILFPRYKDLSQQVVRSNRTFCPLRHFIPRSPFTCIE